MLVWFYALSVLAMYFAEGFTASIGCLAGCARFHEVCFLLTYPTFRIFCFVYLFLDITSLLTCLSVLTRACVSIAIP